MLVLDLVVVLLGKCCLEIRESNRLLWFGGGGECSTLSGYRLMVRGVWKSSNRGGSMWFSTIIDLGWAKIGYFIEVDRVILG